MAGSRVTAALIVLSLVTFLAAIFFNAYLSCPRISPFGTTFGNLIHQYDTGITPTDATFCIWSLIYLWLFALTVYCTTLLWRKSRDAKQPLYIEPGFISAIFFVAFILSMIGNPVWIVVFLMERLVIGSIVLLTGVFTTLICLISSVQRLDDCGFTMTYHGLKADIWCTRIIVQNGIALYLAWVICATLIQTVSTAFYVYSVCMDTACYAALWILTAVILSWFVLETFFFDRKLRYVFAQYIAFLAALYGGYAKHYNPAFQYTQYALGLLIVTAVFTAIKIAIIIVRSIRDPIYYPPKC